jgi:hypothetical protein
MTEARTGWDFRRERVCLALALLALACGEHSGARPSGLDGAGGADGGAATDGPPSAVSNSGATGTEPTNYVADFASWAPESLGANTGDGGAGTGPQPIVAPYGISLVCGDAIVGINEECDDGPGTGRDACTEACKTQDQPVVALAPAQGLDRYLGAGRHPIAGLASGFATTYMEVGDADPAVAASLFNIWGQPTHHVTVSEGASPIDDANPVVAALPDGSFAFAWGDFDGDGSDLGVALRQVSAAGTIQSLRVANSGTEFSQLNPDILWTGTELVVAWEDYADESQGPDIRYRTFDAELNPTSDDVTLAGSELPEAAVSLALFNGGWAAAYREGLAGGDENVVVRVGDASFRVGPFQGGPLDDRPALVGLDATHLLVVFSAGTDPGAAGVDNVPRLRHAVIDVAGSPTQASQALAPLFDVYTADLAVSQMSPSLAPAPDGSAGAFVSWRSEARPGDAIGDQIWLKFMAWNASTATLTTTEQESPIPRPWAENLGDQRRPQLAAVGLPPSGALAIAWDDYSHSQGVDAGDPDVVVRYAPSRPPGVPSHACTPVTVTADAPVYSNVYTGVPGVNVTWTANATCTITPQYQFYIRPPNGAWSMVQDWSTTNTYAWNTSGLALGIWNVQVWVRDIGYTGTPPQQANAGRVFELNASAACTSQSSTATPKPVVKGGTVTLVNTAGSCPSPEFSVSHLPPGGTYQLESAYAAANSTYLWDTTNAIIGTHYFQVLARTQGSAVAYQAYSTFWVNVTASAPCTGASTATSPSGQATVGTQVTFTTTASGCSHTEYRILHRLNGTWVEASPYSSANASWIWDTSQGGGANAPGVHTFQVWVRTPGSSAANEAYSSLSYTLTGP